MAVDLEYYGVPPADYREQENRTRLSATAGQTTFTALYSPGYVDVFFNGAKLDPFTEFTGTDGANIVLAAPAALGDIVEVVSRAQVQLANIYTQAQVNSLLVPYFGVATGTGDAQVVTTNPTFSSYVDGLQIKLRAVAANASTTPTLVANGLAAKTIVSNFGDAALFGADWGTNTDVLLRYNQALDRLVLVEGALTSVTPAQFDNSHSIPTTAFVQQAIGNFNAMFASTTQTLAPSAVGSVQIATPGAPSTTTTLPLTTSVLRGSAITFSNLSSNNQTLATQGADTIVTSLGSAGASIVLFPGDSATFSANGGAYWYLTGGTLGNKGAAQFSSSLVAPGYQKLPSGLIMQWGRDTGTSTAQPITFPLAFPIALLTIGAVIANATPPPQTSNTCYISGETITGFTLEKNNAANAYWWAIGH